MKAVVFILILLVTSCSTNNERNNLQFNADAWKQADKRTRGRMSSDLQNSKLLFSKGKSDVEQILGKPNDEGAHLWIYDVNTNEWLNVQQYQFNIYFDENDKVALSYVAN